MLNTNNKITYLITGQQAPSLWFNTGYTSLYALFTKGHIAMHTVLNLKWLCSLVS